MNLYVLDLEMNQPSQKIIQVGAVNVHSASENIIPIFDEIVNPGELPDKYITKLTGITPQDVEKARSLKESLQEFWSILDQETAPIRIAAWGDDCEKIYRDSLDLGIQPPDVSMYDLRRLCDLRRMAKGSNIQQGRGLKKMLRNYQLTFEGHHHNAYDDAYMTGKLFLAMLESLQPFFQT